MPWVSIRRTTGVVALGATLLAASAAAQTGPVSRAPDGTPGNLSSTNPSLSRDGRYVAFSSDATNLVAGDTNGVTDIFVHDRVSAVTTRVSVASDGAEANGPSRAPSISGDGRHVAFESDATNLDPTQYGANSPGPGDHNAATDVFVHDRQTARTTRVSVGYGRVCAPTCFAFVIEANGPSRFADISDNGRFVAFASGASNLVADDTNGNCSAPEWFDLQFSNRTWCADVFVVDAQGGEVDRVSVGDAGVESDGWSGLPSISADGRLVAFDSSATNLSAATRPPCDYGVLRHGVFLRDRSSRTTARLDAAGERRCSAGAVSLSPNGARVGFAAEFADNPYVGDVVVLDLASGARHRRWFQAEGWVSGLEPPRLSDSDLVAHGVSTRCYAGTSCGGGQLWDLNAGWTIGAGTNPVLSGDGSVLAIVAISQVAGGFYLGPAQVYADAVDGDGDTLPDAWERQFAFDPGDPADAASDPDGDGRSTLDEWLAGTHPRGTWHAYFAEGATGFFQDVVTLVNPASQSAVAQVRTYAPDGTVRQRMIYVPGLFAWSLDIGAIPGLEREAFSMVVEADRPLAAEREMSWDGTTWDSPRYGAHAEIGVPTPATAWYLAEGATHSGFDLFYLVANAGDEAASVEVTYLRPTPVPPFTRTYAVAAHSRLTIWVDQEDPLLASTDVSAVFRSDRPVVVERAMYLTTGERLFEAGHAGAAIATPVRRWILAEGSTQAPLDTFILVANPGVAPAEVNVTYLLPDGATRRKKYTVPGLSRFNIWTNRETLAEDSDTLLLPTTAFSAIVESVNDVPIVVERAMWWGRPTWYEGHLSAGIADTGTEWLSVGRGGWASSVPNANDTYVLVANPSDRPGRVRVGLTFQYVNGPEETIDVLPTSRTTISLRMLFGDVLGSYDKTRHGVLITSLPPADAAPGTPPPDIVVERASYWDSEGVFWGAGTCAAAMRVR